MGLKRQPFLISYFTCPICKAEIPLPRRKGNRRCRGHIKDLWCPECKRVQKFVENY